MSFKGYVTYEVGVECIYVETDLRNIGRRSLSLFKT